MHLKMVQSKSVIADEEFYKPNPVLEQWRAKTQVQNPVKVKGSTDVKSNARTKPAFIEDPTKYK